ncbi:MAG: hypothetical protein V3U98_07800 [Acidobacteriota bacterium]
MELLHAAPIVPFPTLAVRVRDLGRLVASGAPPARVRAQLKRVRREHQRRLQGALRMLRVMKPLCQPELQPLWRDTLDSAILLLHLNDRDFRSVLTALERPCGQHRRRP